MRQSVATLYPDWPQHAQRIRDAVAGLSAEQLARAAAPDHDPIWALAAHVAGTRVYWLCGVFGEPGAEGTPIPDPLTGEGWEDDLAHPRSADELAWALDTSYEVIRAVLDRWAVDDLGLTAERHWADTVQVHTRASVLNRLFSHDAFHAGEIGQLLGVEGWGVIDLWRRTPPAT
jgi:uncharacterized damage-inducible protein DinB